MSNFDEIIHAAQTIAKDGKQPTIALLKNYVKAPLPELIKGLKMWQQNPDKEINLAADKAQDKIDAAEQALSHLVKEQIAQQVKDEVSTQLANSLERKLEAQLKAQTDALSVKISELESRLSALDKD